MSLAQIAQEAGLPRVGARPPLFRYLGEVWQRREFIATMARFRMRSEVEGNRLGIVWIVLRPLLNALIYGLIFGLLQGNSRPEGYAAYVVVGVFIFEFFTGCFNDGSKSISGNRNLVQSLNFPRMTLPLATVVQRFLSLCITLVVLVPILALFGHFPRWEWLLMIPLLALYTLFNTGIAFITARLTVHVADLTQLLPFVSRIIFYTSGVLFNVKTILEHHPAILALYDYHPIYQVLQISRSILVESGSYPLHYWPMLAGISVATLVVGVLFFWSAEERYGRD